MAAEKGIPDRIENIDTRLARLEHGQRTLRADISSLRTEVTERIVSQTQRWTATLEETEQSLKTSIGAEIHSASDRLMTRVEQNEENLRRLESKIENLDGKINQVLHHITPDDSLDPKA